MAHNVASSHVIRARARAPIRDLESHPWRYLVLFVPGVALSLFGRVVDRPVADNVAIAVFGVALFLVVAWVHRRSARRLQREIDSFEL